MVTGDARDFRVEWSASRLVVALESGLHFNEEQARRISKALASAGVERLWVVEAEGRGVERLAFDIAATPADLLEISREFMSIPVLLVDQGSSGAVLLCTIEDYILVSGGVDFVLELVGDLDSAEETYRDFVKSQFEVAQSTVSAVFGHFARSREMLRTPPNSIST